MESNGRPKEREVVILVPDGAVAAITTLSVDIDGSPTQVVVPNGAVPGDFLVLTQDGQVDANGGWYCKAIKRVKNSKPTQPEASSLEEMAIFVPPWAIPGETALEIDVGGGQKLSIKVPPGAKPTDKLLLSRTSAPNGTWRCALKKDYVVTAKREELSELIKKQCSFDVPFTLPDVYEQLVVAINAAGGFVTPKICRGSAPPLHIPGVIACERIAEGDLLCRIPGRLHLSPRSANLVMPPLHDALESQGELLPDHLLCAMNIVLVSRIFQGLLGGHESLDEQFLAAGVDAPAVKVWKKYAERLLSVDFSDYGYFRAASDLEGFLRIHEPSPQGDFIADAAVNMLHVHATARNSCPPELLGPRFDEVKFFCQAQLCIRTRCFQTSVPCTLVPIIDDFNHSPNPGARWEWNNEEDAMVLVAIRAHDQGEEIFHSYGHNTNPMLYQVYGFTLAPNIESSWSYQFRPDYARSITDAFLPESHRQELLSLDSKLLDDSLVSAFNAIAKNGCDPADFLLLLCVRCRDGYENDEHLGPALEALKRARSKQPSNSKWWEELPQENKALANHDLVRVKMSEFLCLTAHIEAVEFYLAGQSGEDCLEGTENIYKILSRAFECIKEAGCFEIKTIQKVS